MRSNSLDSKLKAKEVELKRHEQEIADQDEVWKLLVNSSSCTCDNVKVKSNVHWYFVMLDEEIVVKVAQTFLSVNR